MAMVDVGVPVYPAQIHLGCDATVPYAGARQVEVVGMVL